MFRLDAVRTIAPATARPRGAFAALVAIGALALHGCASTGRDARETQRAEEAVEVAEVVPTVALPVPAPAPKPVRRVASEWPAESIDGALAQPISELVRAPGAAGGAAQRRAVVRAIDIPFESGALVLGPRARTLLDRFAARLNLNDASYFLEIQGHADATGTEAANIAIGLQRAEVVRSYLLAATKIPSARIAVVSLGAGRPVADNSSAEGRAANRRVFVLALR